MNRDGPARTVLQNGVMTGSYLETARANHTVLCLWTGRLRQVCIHLSALTVLFRAVDLQKSQDVSLVRAHNHMDGVPERLLGFGVYMGEIQL